MIPESVLNRKGARSLKDLDPEVIHYLNEGKIPTKNLMEWLAADQLILLKNVLEKMEKMDWFSSFETAVLAQKKRTANSDVKVIGETFGLLTSDISIYNELRSHTSDIVRCWACWGESIQYDQINELIKAMKPYAADQHFGVREVVIFASKERMIENLESSIDIIESWTNSEDENIRRFAAEALRPVGVWTKKVAQFQENPQLGISLIEPLKSDASKYVRDSVGNWLNDASKTSPEWVIQLCKDWGKSSATKETAYIIKKAMRTIEKKSK